MNVLCSVVLFLFFSYSAWAELQPDLIYYTPAVVKGTYLTDDCKIDEKNMKNHICTFVIEVTKVFKGAEDLKGKKIKIPIDRKLYSYLRLTDNDIFILSKVDNDFNADLLGHYETSVISENESKDFKVLLDVIVEQKQNRYFPHKPLGYYFAHSSNETWLFGNHPVLFVQRVSSLWAKLLNFYYNLKFKLGNRVGFYQDRHKVVYVEVREVLRGDRELKNKIIKINYFDRPHSLNHIENEVFDLKYGEGYLLNLFDAENISYTTINIKYIPYGRFAEKCLSGSAGGHSWIGDPETGAEYRSMEENLRIENFRILLNFLSSPNYVSPEKIEKNVLYKKMSIDSYWKKCISSEKYCIDPEDAGIKLGFLGNYVTEAKMKEFRNEDLCTGDAK